MRMITGIIIVNIRPLRSINFNNNMKEGFLMQDKLVDEQPIVPKTSEISKQQEMSRIIEALKVFWNKEKIHSSESFTHTLDRVEILEALKEREPLKFEEALETVKNYHADWHRIEEVTQLPQEFLKGRGLQDLMIHQQALQVYVKRISDAWRSACSEYRYRNLQLRGEGRMSPEEEFGIDIFDIDYFLIQPIEDRENLLSQYPELNEMRIRFHVDKIQDLKNMQRTVKKAIHGLVEERPGIIRDLITKMQNSEEPINDQDLDDLFRIKTEEAERNTNYAQLSEQHPNEELWQGGFRWTPYEVVRTMVKKLNMDDSDVLYDLGSGFGRVPIYTSLATYAQCKGIEIVPQRVAESIAVKNKLGVNNLEFIQGNVLEQDYSDGTVFFLFNPFSPQTLEEVNKKLRQLAETKKIRVVSLGPSTSFFNKQDWLKTIEPKDQPWCLTIYESQ